MTQAGAYAENALSHIRYLSELIGGRGSCTVAERQAAEYAADQMRAMGVSEVHLEPYQGAPSTYRPYAIAFAVGLMGTLLGWLIGGQWVMAVAAVLSALGAWGMLAETDFADNWLRWFLPKASSQNAVGVIPPASEVRNHVVLCAHLDTHRTPIFYSTKAWQMLFGILVRGALLSLVVGAIAFGLAALFNWNWVRWIGPVVAVMELFALSMCLHAEFTPFSAGANDNASGVGVILGLAERLLSQRLAHTEVWLAFTGCEEASAYGIASFLDTHSAKLGDEAVYIFLDQVGLGRLLVLTADGLIMKRKTYPHAMGLARRADAVLPDLELGEHVGIAYTDVAVATKRGVVALTVDALPAPDAGDDMRWHQMSDTLDHINLQTLADAHAFSWQLLQDIDHRF